MDDAVEIFLDTKRDRKTYFQFIVNTLGTVQDADTQDGTWDGDVKTAVKKGKGYYDIEISIALVSMKASATPGATWGLNLARDRQADPAENSPQFGVPHLGFGAVRRGRSHGGAR